MAIRYGDRTRVSTPVSGWLPPGGFDPLVLSPEIWLDAADTATISESGGSVSQWNDKSGNGRNVTQATAAAQPGTNSATQNGRNILTFDGNDSLVAATAATWKFMHDGTKYFVSIAAQMGTTANPAALYTVFATAPLASANVGAFFAYDDRSPTLDSPSVNVLRGQTGTYVVADNVNNILLPNTFLISSFLLDPGNATASERNSTRINGGWEYKVNTFSGAVSTANPTNALTIGAAGGGGSALVGRIGEIIIVSGANATDANRQLVRNYLNTKWMVYS